MKALLDIYENHLSSTMAVTIAKYFHTIAQVVVSVQLIHPKSKNRDVTAQPTSLSDGHQTNRAACFACSRTLVLGLFLGLLGLRLRLAFCNRARFL